MTETDSSTGTLPLEELTYFGVWGLLPTGECACPRGTWRQSVRDVWIAGPGTCDRPGKHPVVVRLDGGALWGYPRGLRSAVDYREWAGEGGERARVEALGGRAAACVPDWAWVLDVDSVAAWRGLVRLFKAGALGFGDVMAAARTPRGWHVWVRMENAGWRLGTAQSALNDMLARVGAPRGLEAKSEGGYVVLPDSPGTGPRAWVPVRLFAQAVADASRVAYGWGAQWRPVAVERLAAGVAPAYAGSPGDALGGVWEEWSDEQKAEWSGVQWANLHAVAARLSGAGEGGRNNALNRAAYIEGAAAVRAGNGRQDVERILIEAGIASGLTDSECRATVRSGLRAGLDGEDEQ